MINDLPLADCRWCSNMRLSSRDMARIPPPVRSDRDQWPRDLMVCRHPLHDPAIYAEEPDWVHCNHYTPVRRGTS